jgi:hypothetical protein
MLGGTALAEMGLSCIDGTAQGHHHHGSHATENSKSGSSSTSTPQKIAPGSDSGQSSGIASRTLSIMSGMLKSLIASINALILMVYKHIFSRPFAFMRDLINQRKSKATMSAEGPTGGSSGKGKGESGGGNLGSRFEQVPV